MFSSSSSNVILAKARAMYGQSLNQEDYENLLKSRSVSEVASYLKKIPAYNKELSTINENSIHRGHLEALLHQKLYDDYAKLCRYEISVGEHFSDYIIEKGEVEQILTCLRLIKSGRSHEYILTIPLFFSKYTKIDFYSLAKAQTLEDVSKCLEHTEYKKILDPFILTNDENIFDFTAIENALYTHLYKKTFTIIDKYAPKGAKNELCELIGSYIDYENVARVMRLKKYYKSNNDFIRTAVLPFSFKVNASLKDKILACETRTQIKNVLKGTNFGKMIELYPDDSFDLIAMRCSYSRSLKKLRFSVNPSVVMFAYVYLMEIEIENITNIIEGIRYNLLPKEIKTLLVGVN